MQKEVLLVFFHGIGDSHLNYQCFFEMPILDQYDLFVMDLLGHGRSGDQQSSSFYAQVKAIEHQLKPLVSLYEKIIFVPHSMGGIHATLLAKDAFAHQISGIYAIETSVTQYGSFVAQTVFNNETKGVSFNAWFNQFCDEIYLDKGIKNPIFRRYYAGLQFVRKDAFLQNALEMLALSVSLKGKKYTHLVGEIFTSLRIPKVYCSGTSTPSETISFLLQQGIQVLHFDTDCHWVAQACLESFCEKLNHFVQHYAVPIRMSSEKMESELIYYACLFQLNLINGANVNNALRLFDLLTQEGVYHDAFLDLMYDSDDKVIEELSLCYKLALDAMNVLVPSGIEDMTATVIKYHLTKIIRENASPIDEIGALYGYFMISAHEHDAFPPPLSELFRCYYVKVCGLYEYEYKDQTWEECDKTNRQLVDLARESLRFLSENAAK